MMAVRSHLVGSYQVSNEKLINTIVRVMHAPTYGIDLYRDRSDYPMFVTTWQKAALEKAGMINPYKG